jgi:uncharacterized protein YbjT (DUF2867 family)
MFVGAVSEMKVAIFGSTGGTGRIMVGKALDKGWDVTAAEPEAQPRFRGARSICGWPRRT